MKFDTIELSPDLQKAIAELGYEEASPIQEQAIPCLIEGYDVIGQAQTGTGKTAAFAIPVIDRIHSHTNSVQALVLCPTRELALQVTGEFSKLAKYKRMMVVTIYGGQSIERQIQRLRQKPQIVVGTPGRVLDLINRGALRLDKVEMVVLDEADEMLNMGFRPDIEKILKQTSPVRQTALFSATMPKSILDLAQRYQRNALHVKAVNYDQPVLEIEQSYCHVEKTEKMTMLMNLLNHHRFESTLVFCNTKWKVDALVKRLKRNGYSAEGLHGGMSQAKRDTVMQAFRQEKIRILVATDLAARGIDVHNIEAVFNYDLPKTTEFYTHRIGRTGRAGKSGLALSFVQHDESEQLREIRQYHNLNLFRQELPA